MGISQSPDSRPLKYFDSGTIIFERVLPACTDYNAAGVPNYTIGGLEGDFLTLTFGQWNWKQRVSGTLGWREINDLVSDIEFEGGYTGGMNGFSTRFGFSLGTVISYQPNPKLEISIPVSFLARRTSEYGRYFLYPGQAVNEVDEVENHDANSANKVIF